MPASVNISLFAHILLDSESSGHFGAQGNTFHNTANYLLEYFKTLPPDQYNEIRSLAEGMTNFVDIESWISTENYCNNLTNLIQRIHGEIVSHPSCLIPGGWKGIDGPGHAMIYQFEKMADGGLSFSIHNAGSGLEYHEKTSSTEKELFSPVKTYTLPPPVNPAELDLLIKRLIVPQLIPEHSERKKREFDARTVYGDIELSLSFLNAKLVPQNLSQAHATTAGQLSGTCSQRSIHQMLKVTFGDLPKYQRFIFDFKMHVLHDFINTHPAAFRSPKITEFIQKAITNNLRILQAKDMFKTQEEKESAIQQLKALQQNLMVSKPDSPTQNKASIASTQIFKHKLDTNIASFSIQDTPVTTSKSVPPGHMPLNSATLLTDLDALINECRAQQAANPLWVMDQIEQAMLKLPIPESTQKNKPCYSTIDFYHSITTQEHFEKMEEALDALQSLYVDVCPAILQESTIPSQFVTEYSLFVLRDYFDVKGEAVTGKPCCHEYIYSSMACALSRLAQSPYLATDHPKSDNRMRQLLTGFGDDTLYPCPENGWSGWREDMYKSFLDQYPELQRHLSAKYQALYANNQSKFHQSMRQKGLTTLFVLLEQLDNYELKPDSGLLDHSPELTQLIKQLKRQHALNQFFSKGINLLSGMNGMPAISGGRYGEPEVYATLAPLKVTGRSTFSNYPCLQIPEFDIHLGQISEKKSITNHKYNLAPSAASNALLQGHIADYNLDTGSEYWKPYHQGWRNYQNPDYGTERTYVREHLDGNQVQLVPLDTNRQSQVISKDDYFMRDLFHLRLVPEQQIKLTLDYFGKTEFIGRLDDPNVQLYLEGNLFEPGRLTAVLHEDPTFLSRMDAFIDNGLHYFSEENNQLNQTSLFFVQLKTRIHNYAMLATPDAGLDLLKADQIWLSKLIEQHTDPDILAPLHTCRFFNAMTQFQLTPDQPDATLQSHALDTTLQSYPLAYFFYQFFNAMVPFQLTPDQNNTILQSHALVSFFYMQTRQHPHDTAASVEQERAALDFKAWLQTIDPAIIQSLIEPIMHSLLPELKGADLTITNDHPVYQVVNNTTNNIYTLNAEQGRIFQNGCTLGPIPVELKNHPFFHRSGLDQASSCLLHQDGQTISFTHPSHVRIKKDGNTFVFQKEWRPGQWYQLKDLSNEHGLPAILTDDNMEAWVSNTSSLLVKNAQPVYEVDQQGVFHALDDQGRQTGQVISSPAPAYAHLFTRFENSKFFLVNLDEATQENGTVDFSRYGFSLAISGEKVTIPGTDYVMLPTESSVFSPEIASLQFGNGIKEQCIVAVQPFYCNPEIGQTEGAYYQLTHDTSMVIPNAIINRSTEDRLITNLPARWSHHDSARTITYELVNGKPKPTTTADALYLCYLYLATHEVDKAWAVLVDIDQRLCFTGSTDELTCLSWIVQALPRLLTKKDNLGLTHDTPEYVACQLKALALYTDFLNLNDSPELSNDQLVDKARINGHYEEICLDNTKKFCDDLPKTIHALYSRHQQGVRHLNEKYTLRDEECLHLLNYCNPQPSNPNEKAVASGSLGYEQRRLSLKKLLKEYQRLEAVQLACAASGHPLPDDFTKRTSDIRQQITNENRIAKRYTKLVNVPIDMSLRQVDPNRLSAQSRSTFDSWNRWGKKANYCFDDESALNELNSGIEEDRFIVNFLTLYDIARSGTDEEKSQLKDFCIAYLAKAREVTDTNVPTLTNILYRVLNNPDKFPEISTITFNRIKEIASSCDVPPIEVLQARDVYGDILTSNQMIWDELEAITPAFTPMPPLAPIYTQSLADLLHIEEHCKAYRQLEVQYQLALNDTPLDEEKAGLLKFNCIKAQRHIAETILKSADTREALKKGAQTLHDAQVPNLEKLWNDSLTLANKTIHDSRSTWHLGMLAAQRHALTKQELSSLYLHADMSMYREKTGLSFDECLQLHRFVHETIALEVRHQQVIRLLNALKQAGDTNTPQPTHLHQIASALINENVTQAQTAPELMLFQYAENLLIHPRQAEVLESLLSTPDDPHHVNNSIEKVIMGGGKSKVILPLLAEKKATGTNLVVVEVPRALLATNHMDLNSTSQRLFGQKAHRFEFTRGTDCSPERLKTIYQTFSDIMSNREYLITTGESMQSLELKYIELLLEHPENPDAQQRWEEQVYWASKITSLIKQRGDVVMDEVHEGLLLKKKLNYTMGIPQPIDSKLIQHSIALYQFANQLGHLPTIDDFLSQPNSPLMSCFHAFNPQLNAGKNMRIREELRAYFNNESMPALIEQATPEMKDRLAFYKEQLTLLPQTQSRHYKEHYGPSETQPTVLKRALAIPYAASNRPNERSRFSNTLETINYTIQSLLAEELSEALLRVAIEEWQSVARNEYFSGKYDTLNDTPVALRINLLLSSTGLTLQTINLQAEGQLAALCEKLKANEALKYTIMEEHVLPQITVEPALLHSDAYTHVDMYRSAQGISGTPWNASTYHQRLTFNQQTSAGTDGYIQTVLKSKATSVTPVKFEKPEQFLQQILATKDNVRAIIDISAMFAGISNRDVAMQLAMSATGQILPKPLRYILYFNTQDVLCALDVTNPDKQITLATSDPVKIDQILACSPEERLTYYDQSHTVGTDLKQCSAAHGIVLADNKTSLQGFLQGCMRMRGLAEQQTVSIIVPDNTPASFNDLLTLMAKNEQDQLQEDNFFAAIAKMDNIVRNDLLLRIAALPETDYETRHKMAKVFQRHFIETKPATLFAQYGGICVSQNTEQLLQEHATALINDWIRCLNDSTGNMPASADSDVLTAKLSEIIIQSVPLCKSESKRRVNDLSQETEQQQESLKEMLAEQEMLQESQCYSDTLDPKVRMKGTAPVVLDSFLKTGLATCMQPLNSACGLTNPHFSSSLLVSDHYAQVYEGQTDMLCQYLKPSMAILFRKEGDSVTACLIDMEDVAEFQALVFPEQGPQIWISTTQHTCLAGSFPDKIMDNPHYQSLIEQTRFFNGECMTLHEQVMEEKTPLRWLKQNSSEKMAWFHEHIMPYRQTKPDEFNSLKMILSVRNSIEDSPAEDKKTRSMMTTKKMREEIQNKKNENIVSEVPSSSVKNSPSH